MDTLDILFTKIDKIQKQNKGKKKQSVVPVTPVLTPDTIRRAFSRTRNNQHYCVPMDEYTISRISEHVEQSVVIDEGLSGGN